MNEQAKAWIDYRVAALRESIGPVPLDSDGCVQEPDFDNAMKASAINELVNLREEIDNPPPAGFPTAEHVYLHDADMQRLRLTPQQSLTKELSKPTQP